MLWIGLDTKGWWTWEEKLNEATRLYQGHRNERGGRCNDRGTGDRTIDAGDQMAHAHQLAEVAGHAVWRRRDDGQGGWRSHRPQVSDSKIRPRPNRPRTPHFSPRSTPT